MEDHASTAASSNPAPPPVIKLAGPWSWQALLSIPAREGLCRAIAQRISTKRWFGAKAKTIQRVAVMDHFGLSEELHVLLFQVHFSDGISDIYQLPLTVAGLDAADRAPAIDASSIWAELQAAPHGRPAVLLDAVVDPGCCAALLQWFDAGRTADARAGQVAAVRAAAYDAIRGDRNTHLEPKLAEGQQSNTSIRYGNRLFLKLYRRIETGVNPDWELNAFLAERGFNRIPPLGGAIEYRRPGQPPWTLALLQGFVANQCDAWEYTLQQLRGELQRVAGSADALRAESNKGSELLSTNALNDSFLVRGDLVDAASQPFPQAVERALGQLFQGSRRLGQRTAEMHLALASETRNAAFAPEPVSAADQQACAECARKLAEQTFVVLGNQMQNFRDDVAHMAGTVLRAKTEVDKVFDDFARRPLEALRIRIHGDYHLGQLLMTPDDFVILDFEGEPARPLQKRREKQLALRDVAGMIRSFHYAARTVAAQARQRHPAAAHRIDDSTAAWYFWTSAAFLAAYRHTAGAAAFLPSSDDQFRHLLKACLLEKAIYELRYELNNRPTWVYLPLEALAEIMASGQPNQ